MVWIFVTHGLFTSKVAFMFVSQLFWNIIQVLILKSKIFQAFKNLKIVLFQMSIKVTFMFYSSWLYQNIDLFWITFVLVLHFILWSESFYKYFAEKSPITRVSFFLLPWASHKIVLLKSLRNCKRHNKENFRSKSKSN